MRGMREPRKIECPDCKGRGWHPCYRPGQGDEHCACWENGDECCRCGDDTEDGEMPACES